MPCFASLAWTEDGGQNLIVPEAGRGRDGPRQREMITTAVAEQENKGSGKKRGRDVVVPPSRMRKHSGVNSPSFRTNLICSSTSRDTRGCRAGPGSNTPRELMEKKKKNPGKFGQCGRGGVKNAGGNMMREHMWTKEMTVVITVIQTA